MKRKEKALEYFRNKFNCSQSVFTPFGMEYGLDEDICLKVSCAFGGGMGRMQHTCGALSGALMAIGTEKGKGLKDPEEKKQETYKLSKECFRLFTEKNGSVNCRCLLNDLNMNDPEDLKEILKLDLYVVNCEKYVADAVEITEYLLNK